MERKRQSIPALKGRISKINTVEPPSKPSLVHVCSISIKLSWEGIKFLNIILTAIASTFVIMVVPDEVKARKETRIKDAWEILESKKSISVHRYRQALEYLNEQGEVLSDVELRRDKLLYVDLPNAQMGYVDLREVNLSGANLEKSNLYKGRLSGANLEMANLEMASLSNVDLSGSNMHRIHLRYAGLEYANLSNAELSAANLYKTNLRYANLSGSDVYKADLRYANLSGANLSGANLDKVDLSGANLDKADLSGANLYIANITQKQLDAACISKPSLPPELPKNLIWRTSDKRGNPIDRTCPG